MPMDMRRESDDVQIIGFAKMLKQQNYSKSKIFERILIRSSVEKVFSEALKEWIWVKLFRIGEENYDSGEICICTKEEIKFQFLIWNRENNNILRIGSNCILHFMDKEDKHRLCKGTEQFVVYRCPECGLEEKIEGAGGSDTFPFCPECFVSVEVEEDKPLWDGESIEYYSDADAPEEEEEEEEEQGFLSDEVDKIFYGEEDEEEDEIELMKWPISRVEETSDGRLGLALVWKKETPVKNNFYWELTPLSDSRLSISKWT